MSSSALYRFDGRVQNASFYLFITSDLDQEFRAGSGSATLRRELEGGLEEELSLRCPAVLTIQVGINRPRYATLRHIKQADKKPLDALTHTDLGLSDVEVGEAGSAAVVRRMFAPPKGQAEMIEGNASEQARRLAEIIKEVRGVA